MIGVKDQGREGKRFIQHFLVCLLHKLNHRSMKVDVLNLKGNKRSGKLTTDEKKKKLCPGIPAYQLWAPSYQLRIEKARGLGRKGQTWRENTGKEKIRTSTEIKAKEQNWKELTPFQTICMHCHKYHFPISASWMGEAGLKLNLRRATPLSAFPPLYLAIGNNSGLGKPSITAAATICSSAQLSQLWDAACQAWTNLKSSSLLDTNGLDTVHKVGLFNSGWLLCFAFSCIICCCFPLNKLWLYSFLGICIHIDLSNYQIMMDGVLPPHHRSLIIDRSTAITSLEIANKRLG